DKNVGTSKAVTVSGNTISGSDAGNYTLLQQSGLVADITKANLTVTANDVSKKYGTVPSLTLFSISGLIGSETVGSVTLTSAGSASTASVAGSPYPITPGNAEGGTFSLSNYTVSYVDGKLRVEDIPQTVIPTITVTINVPSVVPAGITTKLPSGTMSIGQTLSNSTATSSSLSLSLPSATTVASAGTTGGVVQENQTSGVTNSGMQNSNSNSNTQTVADTGSTTAVTSGTTNQGSDINQASLPLGGTASAGETQAPFTGVINVSVGGKLVRQSQNAVIPLPDNVTRGLSKGTGNEKVTLDNGAPLPSWLQYDSASRSFKIISQPEKSFNIKVRVQDKNRSWEVNLSSS
ncbi:MBG domain-containing protein, partial [Chlorobium sp. KB01]|uniref:MBG domain-containing protein n=1 Tax=Chlorobium sp. KB01 TaxID=1917528 RepID=UPI0018E9B1A5